MTKRIVSRGFIAFFIKAGLNALLITLAHTRNTPRTSRERYEVKYRRELELEFLLSYLFQATMAKLEKFNLNFSSSELEFFFQVHYTSIVILQKWTIHFGFCCCNCFCTLEFLK